MEQKQKNYLTPADIAELLGIAMPTAYQLIHVESCPKIRLGRKILIPREPFNQWIEQSAAAGINLFA